MVVAASTNTATRTDPNDRCRLTNIIPRRSQGRGRALDHVDRALIISSADATILEAQCTFIDAANRAGVPHLVKLSGLESSVGFEPFSFRFTRNHTQIERYLEASGVAWTHLQPSQF